MITNRLRLALERLEPSDWERFERLASAFLVAEFDELRTVASPSGDEGRDGELFSPTGEPRVLLQYSVAEDWNGKIRRTVKRLGVTFPNAVTLIFVSNQVIGASADAVKRDVRRERGLSLDVRDQSWFVERVLGNRIRERAAEEIAQAIVDPYLASAGVIPRSASELSSPEAVAALTFLGLQWQDDVREKGLTKLAFEAMVRAVLADTDSKHRLGRAAIHEGVTQLVPGHSKEQVAAYVDGALKRLAKKSIRHWLKDDEYCLTHDEHLRVTDYRTKAALAERELVDLIAGSARTLASSFGVADQVSEIAQTIRRAADAILLARSQAFAVAVQTETLGGFLDLESSGAIVSEVSKSNLKRVPGIDWVGIVRLGVRELLLSADVAAQAYMRSLADAYTLLAFLRQTPDVQGAMEKMFSDGQIWLDASVVLPLFAEQVFEGEAGRFTRMIGAALEAGLELFITPGAVEEVERHMNRSLACVRMQHGHWIGSVPYLLERFLASGRSANSFHSWLENFRGDVRPEEDISDYLRDEFQIQLRGLGSERDAAPKELRYALQTLWYEAHQQRRNRGTAVLDEMVITRLVEHDVECYCGTTQLRTKQRNSAFGYNAWWLTVDRQAFNLQVRLRAAMGVDPPDSPVLSADFMVNYLAFGPVRPRVSKAREAQLPLLMELGSARYMTPELMAEAESLRTQLKDLPDRVIRRRIRDMLDGARQRIGPIAMAGLRDLDDELIA